MQLSLRAFVLCGALAASAWPARAQHERHGLPDSTAHPLSAMSVRGERDRILLRSGRTIVDPQAIAASAGSIADLLRAVPGVEIGGDGTVTMRGNANALVMIDGRRTALTGEALAAYLQQMPARSLKRIEATALPSAAQDANGAAGVLNLVFRDADDAEHTSPLRSLNGTVASPEDFMASVAATGHAGRLVHWDAAYSASNSRPQTTAEIARWTALPDELPFTTAEDVRSEATHALHSMMAGATVTPTRATSFGMRGTYSLMRGATSTRRFARYWNAAGSTASSATASVAEHIMPSAELVGTASVERGRVRLVSEVRGSSVRGESRGDHDDLDGDFQYLSATMDSRQRESVLRNDLRVRWSGATLLLGHESRLRRATAEHDARHFGAVESRVFRHLSAVHAGYLTVERSVGAFRGDAGVRVEGEREVVSFDSVSARRATRVFPAVTGEWMSPAGGLRYRVAYGRRVTRPTWEMLNPLGMGDEGFNEVLGNADLLPEVVDQLEVGVERRRARTVLQVTPFVRWNRDAIREIAIASPRGITRRPENLDWARSVGTEVGVSARPTDGIEMTMAGTVASFETAAFATAQRREGVHGMLRVVLDARVTDRSTAQLLVTGQSRRTLAQGDMRPAATLQFAFKRAVADDRGHVTLQLSGPWGVDRHALREAGMFTDRVQRSTQRPVVRILASLAVGGTERDVR